MSYPWLPDVAWEELPGGREARNAASGDAWWYRGSYIEQDRSSHFFEHLAHPDFDGEHAEAKVVERGGVVELGTFAVLVEDVDLLGLNRLSDE